MSTSLPPLSVAQTEIMGIIWDLEEATLSQVCNGLTNNRDLARNTVQTQLTRLVEKGWLVYSSSGKTFTYRATVPRVTAQTEMVQRVLDSLFGGSTEGFVMNLLDGNKLTKAEADRIRARIELAETQEVEGNNDDF